MAAAYRVPPLAAIAPLTSPGLVPTCVPRAKGWGIGRDIGTAGTILEHDLAILVPKASSTAP